MITAVILYTSPDGNCDKNEKTSLDVFPRHKSDSIQEDEFIKFVEHNNPRLIFIESENDLSLFKEKLLKINTSNFEASSSSISDPDLVFDIIKYVKNDGIQKSIKVEPLPTHIDSPSKEIEVKKEQNQKDLSPNVIGIPTMEGYDFITIQNIIRCESYMKCTRVITTERSDIISSYNIGEFAKILISHGFYSPHQSHIINLNKVKRYLKEGTIVMKNGASVPVARRRRMEFLNKIPHL